MKKELKELPDKPSELVELAIKDLMLCHEDPRYEIEYGVWHRTYSNSKQCYVCFAGSVIAQTLQACPSNIVSPLNFILDSSPLSYRQIHKLYALSSFSFGIYRDFLQYFIDYEAHDTSKIESLLNRLGSMREEPSVPDGIKLAKKAIKILKENNL